MIVTVTNHQYRTAKHNKHNDDDDDYDMNLLIVSRYGQLLLRSSSVLTGFSTDTNTPSLVDWAN